MVLSNPVTVNVLGALSIVSVSLNAWDPETSTAVTKVTVDAGETVTFYAKYSFNRPPEPEEASAYRLKVDIYVNDRLQTTIYRDFQEGSQVGSFSFTLSFAEAGTYVVKVDVNLVPR